MILASGHYISFKIEFILFLFPLSSQRSLLCWLIRTKGTILLAFFTQIQHLLHSRGLWPIWMRLVAFQHSCHWPNYGHQNIPMSKRAPFFSSALQNLVHEYVYQSFLKLNVNDKLRTKIYVYVPDDWFASGVGLICISSGPELHIAVAHGLGQLECETNPLWSRRQKECAQFTTFITVCHEPLDSVMRCMSTYEVRGKCVLHIIFIFCIRCKKCLRSTHHSDTKSLYANVSECNVGQVLGRFWWGSGNVILHFVLPCNPMLFYMVVNSVVFNGT